MTVPKNVVVVRKQEPENVTARLVIHLLRRSMKTVTFTAVRVNILSQLHLYTANLS